MPAKNLKNFIDNWLLTWTGNQPEKLLGYYAEDALYRDPARPAGLCGHAEMRPYFQKLLAANPDWVWQAIEVIPTANGCTLKWKATIPAGGQTIEEFGLDIVEIDDGLITRNEVYFDRLALIEAARASK